VVLSGYVRDNDVSTFIAGATAPESGDCEYSVRPPLVHAVAPATAAATTANHSRMLTIVPMRILLYRR
jgi:hypothetical protein